MSFMLGVYDPEGILSTLPAIVTALIGNLTGVWLMADRPPQQKVWGMLSAGTVADGASSTAGCPALLAQLIVLGSSGI